MGGGVIFHKVYIGGTEVKFGFLVRIDTLGGGDFFRWDLKTPSIKIGNTSLKQKR